MKVVNLRKLADIQTGPFGSQLHKEDYVRFGTPIVTVEHLGKRTFTNQNLPCVSEKNRLRLKKYILQEGDIVFSRVGSVDRCSYVDNQHDGWMFSGRCLRVRPNSEIYPLYLYYFLQLEKVKQFIRNIAVGATMPSINTKLLGEVEILVPEMDIQIEIANRLSIIDDKIELNEKINDNLLQQATAIFNERFINLPNIPNGWTKGCLLDIADYLNGLAMQKYRPMEGEKGLPVLKIKELRQGFCDENSEKCSENIIENYIIHNGDVIFSWSGSLLVDLWCGGLCGLNQHLFKVTSDKYEKWFIYLWTAHYLKLFSAMAADKATTMGHIKRGDLASAEVLIPDKVSYQKCSSILKPIIEAIIAKRLENCQLTNLRNHLLPDLLGGKLSPLGV